MCGKAYSAFGRPGRAAPGSSGQAAGRTCETCGEMGASVGSMTTRNRPSTGSDPQADLPFSPNHRLLYLEHSDDHPAQVIRLERRPTRQHLIHHATECPDVTLEAVGSFFIDLGCPSRTFGKQGMGRRQSESVQCGGGLGPTRKRQSECSVWRWPQTDTQAPIRVFNVEVASDRHASTNQSVQCGGGLGPTCKRPCPPVEQSMHALGKAIQHA
eukprot:365645-Chlamydomonas_euryale.AAC.1